jgi:outer membrane receptor protein involved in Fe transport
MQQNISTKKSPERIPLRLAALVGVSATAMAFATGAYAQEQSTTVEEVIVSSSRITSAGFNAPTPTTVIGQDLIEKSAQPNIFTSVAQLPSLQGSTGTQVNNGNTSTGANGMSNFAVRGLGAIRTLTLLDGQRVVPAYNSGIVDVNQLPQLLIERVDVVTGGASASYGSDAVGGVVNFITNKRFEGFKATVQGGITKYGDDKSVNAAAAYGASYLDGRLRFQVSGEYYDNNGIPARDPGTSRGVNGRDWYRFPGTQTRNIAQTPAGQPQNIQVLEAQNNQYSLGGLIVGGPLNGIAFGPGGEPYQFQFGSNCIGVTCIGGEQTANVGFTNTLDGPIERKVLYGRIGYDITPRTEIYATISYADVYNFNQPNAGAAKAANLTIQCDNAYLPQSIKTACAANNITNFRYGISNTHFPEYIKVNSYRNQARYVIGLDSDFEAFGDTWHLSSYVQHGETIADIKIDDITLNARYNNAIDAVVGANGVIQCRSAAARASGCVPLNVIGNNPVNDQAFRYIAPEIGPRSHTFLRQEAAALVLNGTPFNNWAGEVSIAAGLEYREEFFKVRGDPYGDGVNDLAINPADYPSDPTLNNVQGNNWYAGNFHRGGGRYDVKEAFIEAGVPLWDSETFGQADLNLAGRITDYSTSGTVETWKIGAVWDTPVDGLRLRGVLSRDVRAPNLSELFAAEVVMNNTVTDRTTNIGILNLDRQIGNPDLKPEESDNLEAGVVFRPTWLPGFNLSVDYYKVKITGAIQTLGGQQIVDLCQINGNTQYCDLFFLGGTPGTNTPSYVIRQPINLAQIDTDGVNIEASYVFNLESFGIPGSFTARGLATHVFNFTTDTGLPGSFPSETAGANNGNIPNWKVYATQSWTLNDLTLNMTQRFISKGRTTVNQIECDFGSCPAPTVQYGTVYGSHMPSAIYWDVGASYQIREELQVFGKIDNLFDKDPPPNGGVSIYDFFGRTYRVGLRLSM